MKKIILLAGCIALAGCAQVTKVRDFIVDPRTAEALAAAKGWTQAAACSIANASAFADRIEESLAAGEAVRDGTGKVIAVSGLVCRSMGGVPVTPAQ